MKSILESGRQEARKARKVELTEKDKELQAVLGAHKTVINIIGVGGAGNNTLSRLMEVGIKDVVTIAANTDAQDLLYTNADNKILIGKEKTSGLGAGSNPQIGEESARENEKELRNMIEGSDMVFVTCGLGGGTGTGAAPVVAEIARSTGALTIAVVTLPFTEEGVMRWDNAKIGLQKLKQNSDTVIVIQNDKLLEIAPDLPLDAAFKVADEILVNAVKGITELVTEKGLVNLDFADVKAIMREGGTAMIGIGESESENRANDAIEEAIKNPLLDIDITGAGSALLHISGGRNMSLKDAKIIMKNVSEKLDPAARVIWGARMDDTMNETLRVMLIVTGLKSSEQLDELTASDETSFFVKEHSRDGTTQRNRKRSKKHLPQSSADDEYLYKPESDRAELKAITTTAGTSDELNKPEYGNLPTSAEDSDDESLVEVFDDAVNEEIMKNDDNNQKKEMFDIKDIETLTVSTDSDNGSERKNKRVFTEIFEEEAKGDLNILVDAISVLSNGEADQKALKDIKNACSSLKNTAQLFTFEHIESFAASVSNFMDFLILQDVIPIQSLQKAVEDIPDIINELMYEDEDALKRVQEIQLKFEEIHKALEERNTQNNGESEPAPQGNRKKGFFR